MEPQEKMDTQQFIIDRLQDVQRKAEASNFAEALAIMKEVKAADTKNIYLIAIEKQISKLSDPALQTENRAAIIKSLHPMINRAISDIQRHVAVPKPEESQKVQKEAALEKLKSQYFQRSDDYVEKKEYQRALEEIRRIYIIEPGSVVAKEYEKKIEQLAALHARGESPAAPLEAVKETKETVPVAQVQIEQDTSSAKSNKSKILIIAAAVVVLSVGAWFILSRGSAGKSGDQGLAEQAALTQENTTPTLPTTTTSTPQSGKETAPAVEIAKQSSKNQKTASEEKPATSEKKPVTTPVVTQPGRTQIQPAQQPSPQPVVNTPTTQPVQQPVKPASSTPAPMPFVAIESQPELIRREPAVYPEIAKKIGLQGRVTVEVTIDAQGKPIQAKVVKSASDVFNEAAIEAVMKYTFKPAMMSTGPIVAKVMIPIDFRLTQ